MERLDVVCAGLVERPQQLRSGRTSSLPEVEVAQEGDVPTGHEAPPGVVSVPGAGDIFLWAADPDGARLEVRKGRTS
jgi:hypothetical protein